MVRATIDIVVAVVEAGVGVIIADGLIAHFTAELFLAILSFLQ